jgi:hypothetical protein
MYGPTGEAGVQVGAGGVTTTPPGVVVVGVTGE